MIQKEERTRIQGYAYMKMSAKDYINSLPITYQQYIDPAVHPNQIPAHLCQAPAKKAKKQKKREQLLNQMCQEKGHQSYLERNTQPFSHAK